MAPRTNNFREGYHRPKRGVQSRPNCSYCIHSKKGCLTPLSSESCEQCTARGKPCVRPGSDRTLPGAQPPPGEPIVTSDQDPRQIPFPKTPQHLNPNSQQSSASTIKTAKQLTLQASASSNLQRAEEGIIPVLENFAIEQRNQSLNMDSQDRVPTFGSAWPNNAGIPAESSAAPQQPQSSASALPAESLATPQQPQYSAPALPAESLAAPQQPQSSSAALHVESSAASQQPQPSAPALPPELRPEPREPVVWSIIKWGGKSVDFNNETAYLNSVDENGALKPPFTVDDIPDGSGRYQANPVYPFEPVSITRTNIEAWLKGQAIKHAIAAPTFDELLGEWNFLPFAGSSKAAPANAVVPSSNKCKEAIRCCGESKCKDDIKIWSLYYAILMEFAKVLVGKIPWKVVTYGDGIQPDFSRYRYFFNTISHVNGEEVVLRSFACNSLSGRDIVELQYANPLPMCMENEIGEMGFGEFLVRLPGIEFECSKDIHKPYSLLGLYWVRHHAEEYADDMDLYDA